MRWVGRGRSVAGMLIAEEYLLVTRHDRGHDAVGHTDLAVAGALLCELALLERIALTDRRRIEVVDPSPTGDALLDEALTRFAAHEGKKPQAVLHRVGRGLPGQLLDRLARAEVVQADQSRWLGIRWGTRWRILDTSGRDALRAELLAVLAGRQPVDGRTGSLISIVVATDALGHALPKETRAGLRLGELKRSAKEISEGRWGAAAVADVVRETAAATTAVVVAAAASTGGGG